MEPEKIGSIDLTKPSIPPQFVPPQRTPQESSPAKFIAPQVNNVPPPPPTIPKTKGGHHFVAWIIILVLFLLGGGFAYAYIQKIGPFVVSSYTEDAFFSGILGKVVTIESASYSVSGSLGVETRDKDAFPFTIKVSNDESLKKKYFYDSERVRDASSIVSALNRQVGYSYYYGSLGGAKTVPKSYPSTIKDLFSKNSSSNSYYYGTTGSITDPEKNKAYEYKVTDGGKNFELTINFDTDYAISAIKKYGYVSTTTIISGKKVTFTKDSYSYVYLPSEMPKPFLVELGEYMRMLPSDISVSLTFGGASQIKNSDTADWKFNFDAHGDFGDLTYKVNAEALKKDSDYYFRINNIPSLFGDLSNVKGKWVKISSDTATTTDNSYSMISYLKKSIPETEKKYKENRENASKLLKKIVEIADEEKLISFRSKPSNDKIDGRDLIKYDLTLNKEAIIPFYTKLRQEINKDKDFKEYSEWVDEGLVNYLKSEEFNEVFSYIDKNDRFTLWTDKSGFPAIVQNSLRIVPPDTATQLEEKQIKLIFKLSIDDINKNIDIDTPSGAVSIEKLIKDFSENYDSAGMKGKAAATKSNLNNIRAQAEIYYDDNNNTYGKTAFPLGQCKKTAGTLFADTNIAKALDMATEQKMSSATCVSKSVNGKVSSYAISAPLPGSDGYSWCVDSDGDSKQIIGAIKSDSCR